MYRWESNFGGRYSSDGSELLSYISGMRRNWMQEIKELVEIEIQQEDEMVLASWLRLLKYKFYTLSIFSRESPYHDSQETVQYTGDNEACSGLLSTNEFVSQVVHII